MCVIKSEPDKPKDCWISSSTTRDLSIEGYWTLFLYHPDVTSLHGKEHGVPPGVFHGSLDPWFLRYDEEDFYICFTNCRKAVPSWTMRLSFIAEREGSHYFWMICKLETYWVRRHFKLSYKTSFMLSHLSAIFINSYNLVICTGFAT